MNANPHRLHRIATAAAVLGVVALAVLVLGLSRKAPLPGNPYEVDLEPFKTVDPAWIRWREEGTFPVPLETLAALAAARDGSILVSGRSQGPTMLRFDRAGALAAETPLEGAAKALAEGPDGTVYVGLKDHVVVLSPGGGEPAVWPSLGENAFVLSIAADRDDVFVADGGQRLVWRFDATGTLKGVLGETGPSEGGFLLPGPCFDVVLDPEGAFWVVNPGRHRVELRTREGGFLRSWGSYGFEIEKFCGC